MPDPAQTPPLAPHPEPIVPPPARRTPEDWVGAIAMALLAVITFGNVLARYFTNESFAWTEEISISLMVIMTMVAASAAVVRDRHIRIEFLSHGGSPQRQRRLAHLSDAMTALAFLLMFGFGLRLFWDDYRFEVTSPGIGVPQWWYTIWLPILSLLIAARAVQNLIRRRRSS